jgi:hypothetical protein
MLSVSPDPRAAPTIRYGYLTDPDDLRVMLAGFTQARRIFAAPSFAPYLIREKAPGALVQSAVDLEARPSCLPKREDDCSISVQRCGNTSGNGFGCDP